MVFLYLRWLMMGSGASTKRKSLDRRQSINHVLKLFATHVQEVRPTYYHCCSCTSHNLPTDMTPLSCGTRHHRKREAKLAPLSLNHHQHGALRHNWSDLNVDADTRLYWPNANQYGSSGAYYRKYHSQPLERDRDGRYRGQQQYLGSGVKPEGPGRRNGNRDHLRLRHQHQKLRCEDADHIQYIFLPPILPPQYFMAPQQQEHGGYGQGYQQLMKTRKHAKVRLFFMKTMTCDSSHPDVVLICSGRW